MSKTRQKARSRGTPQDVSQREYKTTLHTLQVELVKLQRHFIACDDKILVVLEGRDAAGKDGTIKRIVQHLSPRETRVVALGAPSDRDRSAWYFQRFVPYLPAAREFVLFNRSWYNRAGVERVMGFCSDEEYDEFMQTVLEFEHMLVKSGIKLLKYYLDISRGEQKNRLHARRTDPLKQWKVSPIDEKALKRWEAYSQARDAMLARTHNPVTPWTIVRADSKRLARINLLKDLLTRLHYGEKDETALVVNPAVVFQYDQAYVENGAIAP